MYAESRIHPDLSVGAAETSRQIRGSGGRLRRAGGRRSAWRAEVADPLPRAQTAVAQVRRRQLHTPGFQGPKRQFGCSKGDVSSGQGEFRTAQRAFGVIERLPIKAGGLRLIEGCLQRPEMLPVMNPVPIKVGGDQQDVEGSADSQPERQI